MSSSYNVIENGLNDIYIIFLSRLMASDEIRLVLQIWELG